MTLIKVDEIVERILWQADEWADEAAGTDSSHLATHSRARKKLESFLKHVFKDIPENTIPDIKPWCDQVHGFKKKPD